MSKRTCRFCGGAADPALGYAGFPAHDRCRACNLIYECTGGVYEARQYVRQAMDLEAVRRAVAWFRTRGAGKTVLAMLEARLRKLERMQRTGGAA
jgi:hypothetical protein